MNKKKYFKPGLYTMFYTQLKDIAEQYGYNLLIHGSMNRDLDLIAVPCVDNPKPEQKLIAEFEAYLKGTVIRNQEGMIPFTVLPGGRHNYTISLNRGDRHGEWVRFIDQEWYLDISVIQIYRPKEERYNCEDGTR